MYQGRGQVVWSPERQRHSGDDGVYALGVPPPGRSAAIASVPPRRPPDAAANAGVDSPIDASIREAVRSLVVAAHLQDRATLIGGQAIRDWHAAQVHALTGTATLVPQTRSTTDVDVHLALQDADREPLQLAISQGWDPDPESGGGNVYKYMWRTDPSVTLDLIGMLSPQTSARIQTLVRIGHGHGIGAVRVLEPWILRCHLVERCFTPGFAQLGIHRLTRLGLIVSKLQAVLTAVDEFIAAEQDVRSPATWTSRLAKDLQDLELFLAPRQWVAPLWESRYAVQREEIGGQWQRLSESVRGIRRRPEPMPESVHHLLLTTIMPLVPGRLGEPG